MPSGHRSSWGLRPVAVTMVSVSSSLVTDNEPLIVASGHYIVFPRLSEGEGYSPKSVPLVQLVSTSSVAWRGDREGWFLVGLNEIWRGQTVSFLGLIIAWIFFSSLFLGPRVWPLLALISLHSEP